MTIFKAGTITVNGWKGYIRLYPLLVFRKWGLCFVRHYSEADVARMEKEHHDNP